MYNNMSRVMTHRNRFSITINGDERDTSVCIDNSNGSRFDEKIIAPGPITIDNIDIIDDYF